MEKGKEGGFFRDVFLGSQKVGPKVLREYLRPKMCWELFRVFLFLRRDDWRISRIFHRNLKLGGFVSIFFWRIFTAATWNQLSWKSTPQMATNIPEMFFGIIFNHRLILNNKACYFNAKAWEGIGGISWKKSMIFGRWWMLMNSSCWWLMQYITGVNNL